MRLPLETIEHIAAYIPSRPALVAFLDVLPEHTPAMDVVRIWGKTDGTRHCGFVSFCRLSMSFDTRLFDHYEVDPASIAAYAAATPFAPQVSVTVGNMAQWDRYVDAIAHLVTSVTFEPDAAFDLPNQSNALRDALVACPRVRMLYIRYKTSSDSIGALASIDDVISAAPRMPQLTFVDINGSETVHRLAASSVKSLVQWVETGPATYLRLHHLSVAIDENGRDGVGAALASAISRSTTLETVDLKNVTFFNTHGLFGQPLPPTLRTFRWTSDEGARRRSNTATLARYLVASLASATHLETLHLAGKKTLCSTTLVAELAAALPTMQHLKLLYLKDNSLRGVDIAPLTAVLPLLPALETLRIKTTRLDDAGALALASMLPRCTSLRELMLQRGAYNEASSEALLAVIARMPVLDYVAIDVATRCRDGWIQRLSPLLATCAITTGQLTLYSFNVSTAARAALASALFDWAFCNLLSTMVLPLETIELIALYLPSHATLMTLLRALPEKTPGMQHVFTWGTTTCPPGCSLDALRMTFNAHEMAERGQSGAPVAAYATAAAPFVPQVAVTIGRFNEWTSHVLALAHLVTTVTLVPSNGFCMSPDEAAAIRAALLACPRLTTLCIDYSNWFGRTGDIKQIDIILSAPLPRLVHVDIQASRDNEIDLPPSVVDSLVRWLETRPAVRLRVRYASLAIDDDGNDGVGPAFAAAIAHSTTLQDIDLKSLQYVGSHGLDGLPLPRSTRVFRWTNQSYTDDAAEVVTRRLGQSLATATQLEELRLSRNTSYAFALCPRTLIAELATVLPTMQHLKCLNLKNTFFDGVDVSPLTSILPSLPALATLRVNQSRLDDDGALAFASVLPKCTALRELKLRDNSYNEAAAVALLSATAVMPALQDVEIDVATNCRDGWAARLSPLVARCAMTTRRIVLYSVHISEAAARGTPRL
ncbi:hypothetical protein SDRG_10395 [Saprolegnia diclina VS20]|uniref:F-box domain-containing protein n=1 Tax=Saprolegnia diclina (strain VS20) TaxID=1156394 RepID=T0RP57_SAPDV|nr:hypothetical protein SDRG_10395 [Saprolegnia diclina VS20]EQC31877.1 hypothetical protein SDRG_10395 [Saprolegnia diclina VS20]|eukprot:XP_008614605.1 hypothetical protein SDRG_10395 [Saprolegnia diclina VS20]